MITARVALERLQEGNRRFVSEIRSQGALTSQTRRNELEADYKALESAYSAVRAGPGQPVYAHVEGRVVERVNMEGPARPTLVVEKFVELRPGEKCPVPPQTPAGER